MHAVAVGRLASVLTQAVCSRVGCRTTTQLFSRDVRGRTHLQTCVESVLGILELFEGRTCSPEKMPQGMPGSGTVLLSK